MELLVVYDVNTTTKEGQRRLRAVAKICEGYGQRVQKSVFECRLDRAGLLRLTDKLQQTIEPSQDRLAIYRLREPYQRYVQTYGLDPDIDWRSPIVL